MAQTSSLTNLDEANRLAQLLQDCSQVPRPLTLSELVAKAKSSITQMLKNGHTYRDVATVLASFEVLASESEIEACHSGANSVNGKRGKGKKKKSNKDSKNDSERLIDFHVAEEICQGLAQQAEIRKGLTKEELVSQLRKPIEQMLSSGYTYEDIAEVLQKEGVQIAPTTLKTYYKRLERTEVSQSASQSQNLDDLSDTESSLTQSETDTETALPQGQSSSSKQTSVKAQNPSHFSQQGETAPSTGKPKNKTTKRLSESTIVPENKLEEEFNL